MKNEKGPLKKLYDRLYERYGKERVLRKARGGYLSSYPAFRDPYKGFTTYLLVSSYICLTERYYKKYNSKGNGIFDRIKNLEATVQEICDFMTRKITFRKRYELAQEAYLAIVEEEETIINKERDTSLYFKMKELLEEELLDGDLVRLLNAESDLIALLYELRLRVKDEFPRLQRTEEGQ